jgi:DNA polymerase I-like protein with 3'-5' exonuclease and polymerase domains
MDTQSPRQSELWRKPDSFPTVPQNATIAVDTEAHCEDLKKKGQQFLNGKDYVVGISIAMEDGFNQYYPIAHEKGNVDIDAVGWFKDLLSRTDITAVGANWKFDIEGLDKLGIKIKSKLADMQVTDALIDENQSQYSLNAISKRRGFGEKTPGELEEALVRGGFVKRGEPDWSQIHKIPPKYVGPYASDDAKLTLMCHQQQMKELELEELWKVYELECELIPILWEMRKIGQPVDVDTADELNGTMGLELEDDYQRIVKEAGKGEVDPFSPQALSAWVKELGHIPPIAARHGTNDAAVRFSESVGNEWMLSTGDPLLVGMAKYRQGERFRRDVLENVIINQSHNGRIHASWYSTRGTSFLAGEDGGTRSGRLSSGSPSLQVMPSRHPVYGPILRKLFLPENGQRFFKGDYNSQEIRIAVHFAKLLKLTGSDLFYSKYNENPAFDYHEHVKEMINAVVSEPIDRNRAKNTGLSLQYGMGKARLADRLGLDVAQTITFLETFNKEVPWIKEALNKAMDVANSRGFVRSILGRRRRFNEWENGNYGSSWSKPMTNKKEALLTWGKIKRAGTYKAWNSIVQGTAAEMTKTAMVNAYKAGILPRMSIHDELTASVENEAQGKQMKEIMEHAIELCIPVLVDSTIADNWAGDNKVVIT